MNELTIILLAIIFSLTVVIVVLCISHRKERMMLIDRIMAKHLPEYKALSEDRKAKAGSFGNFLKEELKDGKKLAQMYVPLGSNNPE